MNEISRAVEGTPEWVIDVRRKHMNTGNRKARPGTGQRRAGGRPVRNTVSGSRPGSGAAASRCITLGDGMEIPMLYKDRSVVAIDKPAGWMLAPDSWNRTGRNLQLALTSSIQNGDFWARSQAIRFLRFVHRLDADTSGVMVFARHPGAVAAYSRLFRDRKIEKHYLAVIHGTPPSETWTCEASLTTKPGMPKRMRVAPPQRPPRGNSEDEDDPDEARVLDARTEFRLLATNRTHSLVLARPTTGRTHQIRVHLASIKRPVVGDVLYGSADGDGSRPFPLGLRAIQLDYSDPFTRRHVRIRAEVKAFLEAFGFTLDFDWQSMRMRSRADGT